MEVKQMPRPRVTVALVAATLSAVTACGQLPAFGPTAETGPSARPAGRPGDARSGQTPPALRVRIIAGGRKLSAKTAIRVAFSSHPAGHQPPQIEPPTSGTWSLDDNTYVFQPTTAWPAYRTVTVTVPAGATSTNGAKLSRAVTGAFPGPTPSLLRAQQLLATLDYLPVTFHRREDASATEAPYNAVPGWFSWRFRAQRATLGPLWVPGSATAVTRGALMTFQSDHHLTVDGLLGLHTWNALARAASSGQTSRHAYMSVVADLTLPQTLTVYADGHPALTTRVNSGIGGARTRLGTYPIYRRVQSDTMRGTTPDGHHYVDRGVPWDNYFDGGEAVHGFARPTYGRPQSNGCLELPIETARQVYNMLHVGDLVTVNGNPTAHR
jgi:lipoprotein-anchoring transpeptidase ErfK/SrfK